MPKNLNSIRKWSWLFFFYSLFSLQNKIAKINPIQFCWLTQDCKFPPELLEPPAPLWHHEVVEPLCSGLLMLAGIKSSGEDKALKFWKKGRLKDEERQWRDQAELCPLCPSPVPTWAKFYQEAEDGNGEWMAHLPSQHCLKPQLSFHSERIKVVKIN